MSRMGHSRDESEDMLSVDDLVRHLRRALKYLYDPTELRASPLIDFFGFRTLRDRLGGYERFSFMLSRRSSPRRKRPAIQVRGQAQPRLMCTMRPCPPRLFPARIPINRSVSLW